ncbi:Hsp20/alpha crystallin family protein [Thiocapsa sp. UBA6158]|uniref:Hsp20/alpha crystallin family protein n=1 Tax=Thiocapsa sp. UBA6158 TaxID=1947692 RepID=UPI0025CC69E1|nr:Hsp20/alpha crystallin family protein [Thiocapsa sp. UBA6158]
MRIAHLTVAVLIIVASAPTFAWGPYGPPPPGAAYLPAPSSGGWGGPGPFGDPNMPYGWEPFGPAPFMGTPALPAPWSNPFAAQSNAPSAQPAASSRQARHLSIARRATPDAYLVEIRLANIDPAQVQISSRGRGLRIAYRTRAEEYRENGFGAGDGRGYSVVSGSASQRLTLPPDADVAAMSREVTSDRIQLRIPRMDLRRSAPWLGPSVPERNAKSGQDAAAPE